MGLGEAAEELQANTMHHLPSLEASSPGDPPSLIPKIGNLPPSHGFCCMRATGPLENSVIWKPSFILSMPT